MVQRLIEVISSIAVPLWLTLAATVPPNWSPIKVYLGSRLSFPLSRGAGWHAKSAALCWGYATLTL